MTTDAPMLVVGEALVDLVLGAEGTTDVHPGGSPMNVAVGLARLGRDVTLLTELGDDAYGDLLRRHLAVAGVRLRGPAAAGATSVARASLAADGSAQYTFDVSWTLAGADDIGPAPAHIHTGSLATVVEPGAGRVEAMLESARASSSISYDPNVRPTLARHHEEAVARVERLVALADVVKASAEDVAWLYPDQTIDDVARTWATAGPAIVVITAGADGAVAATASGSLLRIDALPVSVADTVGAGDSYMSALLDGLARSDLLGPSNRARLRTADDAVVLDVVRWAARAAAITVSRPGADPPTTAELLQHEPGHTDGPAQVRGTAAGSPTTRASTPTPAAAHPERTST